MDKTGGNREKTFWQHLKSLLRGTPDTTKELENEILELLEDGEEQGLISSHEEQLINSIFNFRSIIASEIMTPAAEIIQAHINNSIQETVQLINEEGYTRIPIFNGSQDNIIGILHAKDLLKIISKGLDHQCLEQYLNQPMIIPESKPITDLLRDFQSEKSHMAIVTDEFGGVRGLITLEDVIEEIVGEIDDEHDQEDREVLKVDQQTILVDARIDIEVVEKNFTCSLPTGPYESVGGLIIHVLGRIPKHGEIIQIGSLALKVLTASPRRVRTVRIRKL